MAVKLWNFNVKSQDLTEPIKLSYMSERIDLRIYSRKSALSTLSTAFM